MNRNVYKQLTTIGMDGLLIEKDAYDGDIYVALWQFGQQPMSIEHKLRWIWSIIKGRPFRDQIVIDPTEVQYLIDGLEDMKE